MALKVRTMGGLPSNENDDTATAENDKNSQSVATPQDLLNNLKALGAQRANSKKKNRMPVSEYTCIYCGNTSPKKDDSFGNGCGYDWACPAHQDFGSMYVPDELYRYAFAYSVTEQQCMKKIAAFAREYQKLEGTDSQIVQEFHEFLVQNHMQLSVKQFWPEWLRVGELPLVSRSMCSGKNTFDVTTTEMHKVFGINLGNEPNSMEDFCRRALNVTEKDISQAIVASIRRLIAENPSLITGGKSDKYRTWMIRRDAGNIAPAMDGQFRRGVIEVLDAKEWNQFQNLWEMGSVFTDDHMLRWHTAYSVMDDHHKITFRAFLDSLPIT